MIDPSTDKQWLRFSRAANGVCSVTCTIQRGNLSARWSAKAYSSESDIKAGVKEARAGATRALDALERALG